MLKIIVSDMLGWVAILSMRYEIIAPKEYVSQITGKHIVRKFSSNRSLLLLVTTLKLLNSKKQQKPKLWSI